MLQANPTTPVLDDIQRELRRLEVDLLEAQDILDEALVGRASLAPFAYGNTEEAHDATRRALKIAGRSIGRTRGKLYQWQMQMRESQPNAGAKPTVTT